MYFRFKQKNFKSWERDLAAYLGKKIKNNMLSLPDEYANGFCYADSIDRSFSFILMDAELKETCTLHRVSNNQLGLIIYFNQIVVSDYFGLRSKKNIFVDDTLKNRSNIFVSSSNTELELTYTPGTKLKRLGIYLSPQWVSEHFDASTKLQLDLLTRQNLHQVNTLLITEEMKEKLDLIFDTNFHSETAKLALKTRIIILLEYFLSTFFNESLKIKHKKIIPDEDIHRLKTIELLLTDEETEEFPSITQLARIARMSSTKLKQKFKQVYGLRLYEFYNKQRLNKAKELIQQGSAPKEVGLSIGFTDVSNFTKAFKKEYGYTPGSIYEKESLNKKKA